MIDTVALTHSFHHCPKLELLRELGWLPRYRKFDDACLVYVLNPKEKGSHAPRLTFSRSPDFMWHLRAEVSIPAWLYGSNLHLPDENAVAPFLDKMTEFVTERFTKPFDARTARVSRVDFTIDLPVGESNVAAIIEQTGKVQMARYDCHNYNGETVTFSGKGKSKSKAYTIYNKLAEVSSRKHTDEEIKLACGIVRLEVSLKLPRSIKALAEKLKLPNTAQGNILRQSVSSYVLDKAQQQLQIKLLRTDEVGIEVKLIECFGIKAAKSLIGHCQLIEIYGRDYYKVPHLNAAQRTYFDDAAKCRQAGVHP